MTATDEAGNTATHQVTINILDLDDVTPTGLTIEAGAVTSLAEGTITADTEIKLADILITDVDGGNNQLQVSDNQRFEVRENETGGKELWLKSGAVLDYETATEHKYDVTISVVGHADVNVDHSLTVTDVNDEAPSFADATVNYSEDKTTAVTTLSATADVASATLSYAITGGDGNDTVIRFDLGPAGEDQSDYLLVLQDFTRKLEVANFELI